MRRLGAHPYPSSIPLGDKQTFVKHSCQIQTWLDMLDVIYPRGTVLYRFFCGLSGNRSPARIAGLKLLEVKSTDGCVRPILPMPIPFPCAEEKWEPAGLRGRRLDGARARFVAHRWINRLIE